MEAELLMNNRLGLSPLLIKLIKVGPISLFSLALSKNKLKTPFPENGMSKFGTEVYIGEVPPMQILTSGSYGKFDLALAMTLFTTRLGLLDVDLQKMHSFDNRYHHKLISFRCSLELHFIGGQASVR